MRLSSSLIPFLILRGSCCWALIPTSITTASHRNGRPRSRVLPSPTITTTKPFGIATAIKQATNDDDDSQPPKQKKANRALSSAAASASEARAKKKEEVMKQLKAKLEEKKLAEQQQQQTNNENSGLLDKLNPFQAGQNLRGAIGRLTKIGSGLSSETKQKYYLDDRFLEGSGALLSERNPYLDRQDNYVPEVLVIGATSEVGRLVVRRLLLEGRFRVRVLVRDLYSQTLNLLGTGVTYCQGDLSNMESLEYGCTDVDKIVFCAAAPRPDENDFQEKFQYFCKENLEKENLKDIEGGGGGEAPKIEEQQAKSDMEWEQLSSVLEVRAQLAEQVDCIGMQNIVKAYQNVRHADYGSSQAAKRSLFKFSGRPEDFGLFAIDDEVGLAETDAKEDDLSEDAATSKSKSVVPTSEESDATYDDENGSYPDEDPYVGYDDEYSNDEYYNDVEARRDSTVKSQVQWIRNEFGHGVFVGKVPKADSSGMGGQAAIASSRLRSRDDPESGIDLSTGFAGFIARLCADGSIYEAFIRTGSYEESGIEYVCEFSTSTKPTSRGNKSRNKFITVRLPFENFKPILRKERDSGEDTVAPPFKGADLRNIGFRYRSSKNTNQKKLQEGENQSFYVSLSYIKVYRLQPEPEFIYLSDARIPAVIRNGMVRHDRRQLLTEDKSTDGSDDVVQLFDEKALKSMTKLDRSSEETYFKFRGEEILKSSGLSYTIIRVSGFNEIPSGEASTIDFKSSNDKVFPVSRDEVAQVCVSALLDPNALNKSVYMGKKKSSNLDEDISAKFLTIPSDST